MEPGDAVFPRTSGWPWSGRLDCDYIRNIRADIKVFDELSKSLAEFGNELSQLRRITFAISVTGSQFKIDPIVRDEIHRIGREEIGNAFNHSKGSKVEVEIA